MKAQRKLWPGLYHLVSAGFIPDCRFVGVSLDDMFYSTDLYSVKQNNASYGERCPDLFANGVMRCCLLAALSGFCCLMLMASAYAGKSEKPAKGLAASEQQTAAGQPAGARSCDGRLYEQCRPDHDHF